MSFDEARKAEFERDVFDGVSERFVILTDQLGLPMFCGDWSKHFVAIMKARGCPAMPAPPSGRGE